MGDSLRKTAYLDESAAISAEISEDTTWFSANLTAISRKAANFCVKHEKPFKTRRLNPKIGVAENR
jgi:hypothetical protein